MKTGNRNQVATAGSENSIRRSSDQLVRTSYSCTSAKHSMPGFCSIMKLDDICHIGSVVMRTGGLKFIFKSVDSQGKG